MKSIYLTVILLLISVGVGNAQDIIATPIFTFENSISTPDTRTIFAETEWQADSQSFKFRYMSAGITSIFRYMLPSNKLLMTDIDYPCSLVLSDEQLATFGAVGCAQSLSPNGRYVVYPTEERICGELCSNTLAIGDLETGSHTIIRKGLDAGYFVRWSESSNAFLILDNGQTGGMGGIWHVALPSNLISTTEITATLLANFPLGEIGYVDISPDGQQVLINGINYFGGGLKLWNTSLPSDPQNFAAWTQGRTLLDDQIIGGASFISNDPTHILVVTNKGIIKYDLKTDTFNLINTQISRVTSDWVYFSPDVHYALVYGLIPDDVGRQEIKLYQLN